MGSLVDGTAVGDSLGDAVGSAEVGEAEEGFAEDGTADGLFVGENELGIEEGRAVLGLDVPKVSVNEFEVVRIQP